MAGNEPLAVGQLGYSEGPAARPIRELASLNGIWILHPQTISNNYVVRREDGVCVFVCCERSLGCVLMGCVCVCVCVCSHLHPCVIGVMICKYLHVCTGPGCERGSRGRWRGWRVLGINSDQIQMVVFM